MIATLRGTLLEKNADGVVIEVANVGYAVHVNPSAQAQMPPLGEEVLLHVVESVAMYGGGVTLYGFLRGEEKQIFNVLKDRVPGTGAKKALEFLEKASRSLPDFRRAVLEGDGRALVSLFGFTPRTAQKIIAALEGKLDAVPVARGRAPAVSPETSALEDAIQALVSLGYREGTARQAAVDALNAAGKTASSHEIIRTALRHMGRSR